MRYLVSVIDDTTGSATPAEMAVIDAFNDRLKASDLDTALKIAADGSKACNRKVEVRPFLSD